MAAGGGEDARVAPSGGDRQLVGLAVEADVEHPLDARLDGAGDDLSLRPLAEEEVGVGVDHRGPAYPGGQAGPPRALRKLGS